jgi:ParB/RepB/Spo0J family partition protein
MTSGEFCSVFVDQITVPPDRQRKNLGDLSGLMEKISDLGLIHPIVITRDNELVVGERRLRACQKLGHDRILCQYTDAVDLEKKAMEFAENNQRLNLTWQERCEAATEHHELRLAQDRNWTQEQTAKDLGIGPSNTLVSEYLAQSEAYRRGFTTAWEQTDLGAARTILRRHNDRRIQAEKQKEAEYIEEVFNGTPISTEKLEAAPKTEIINADFTQWVTTYTGRKFNFLHCDFPYGIDTDKRQQGIGVAVHGGYDDSPENYWRLLDVLCTNLDRICADSAHIMFRFSMHRYCETLEFFADNSNFRIDPFPLVWMKSDNKGLLPDPLRGPRRIYETCLFGSRGDHKIVKPVSNAIFEPTDQSQHLSTKPEPVLRYFFEMFVDDSTSMLDPTCGSGTALRVAKELNAARVLGIEIDKEFVDRANL